MTSEASMAVDIPEDNCTDTVPVNPAQDSKLTRVKLPLHCSEHIQATSHVGISMAFGWPCLELERLLRLHILSSAGPKMFCRLLKFGWMVSRPHLSGVLRSITTVTVDPIYDGTGDYLFRCTPHTMCFIIGANLFGRA